MNISFIELLQYQILVRISSWHRSCSLPISAISVAPSSLNKISNRLKSWLKYQVTRIIISLGDNESFALSEYYSARNNYLLIGLLSPSSLYILFVIIYYHSYVWKELFILLLSIFIFGDTCINFSRFYLLNLTHTLIFNLNLQCPTNSKLHTSFPSHTHSMI